MTFSFSKYRTFAAKHALTLFTHFYGGFKLLLQNVSKDCLGFLDYLGICFEVSTQFMFQQWKEPETTLHEVQPAQWMLHHFSVVVLKPLLHKRSRTQLSIVLIKNPPSMKFWSFPPDMIKESFQYHLVMLLT